MATQEGGAHRRSRYVGMRQRYGFHP